MLILLLRHGAAGQRRLWTGDDRLRPLSELGERQAHALAVPVAAMQPTAIVSSSYRRCRQTVLPLAGTCGLAVVDAAWLEVEAAGRPDAAATFGSALHRLASSGDGPVVLCSHGEVMRVVLDAVVPDAVMAGARAGGAPPSPGDKAGAWALDWRHGAIVGARYVPPPL